MSETDISRAIRQTLELAGFMTIRVQTGSLRIGRRYLRMAETGTPDIHVVGLGWLEVKVPKGIVSTDQTRWHNRARAQGARVAVVRSAQEALELCQAWRSEDRETERLRAEQRALREIGSA